MALKEGESDGAAGRRGVGAVDLGPCVGGGRGGWVRGEGGVRPGGHAGKGGLAWQLPVGRATSGKERTRRLLAMYSRVVRGGLSRKVSSARVV